MSRLDGRIISVETDSDGNPIAFILPGSPRDEVRQQLTYWREWIGILSGEPERDVWRVQTPRGICEIHCLRPATVTTAMWVLHSWED
jgi:hypothetical protein